MGQGEQEVAGRHQGYGTAHGATVAPTRILAFAAVLGLGIACSAASAPSRHIRGPARPANQIAAPADDSSRRGLPRDRREDPAPDPFDPSAQAVAEEADSSAEPERVLPAGRMQLSIGHAPAGIRVQAPLDLAAGLFDVGAARSRTRPSSGKSSTRRLPARSQRRAVAGAGQSLGNAAAAADLAAGAEAATSGRGPAHTGTVPGRENAEDVAPSAARQLSYSPLSPFDSVAVNENSEIGQKGAVTSRHKSVENIAPDDRRRGLTTTDTVHSLDLGIGGGSKLEATFSDHTEEWSRALAKPNVQRRSNSLELTSEFGPGRRHALCLAMETNEQRVGEQVRSEARREARLNLTPTRHLALNADYVTRTRAGGNDDTIRTVGAVLKLARGSEFSASLRALTPEQGSDSRESALRLSTALGGGGSAANLTAERRVLATDGAGVVTRSNWALGGGMGSGSSRVDVRASVQEQRGSDPQGRLARAATMHLDRRLGPRLTLTVDRDERMTGTTQECIVVGNSTYRVEAKVARNTVLAAVLGWRSTIQEGQRRVREFSARQQMGRVRVEAQQQVWADGIETGTVTELAVEIPTGAVPRWARDASRRHEFRDAREYLVLEEVRWEDIDFAGFRVAGKQRHGGIDDGLHTVTVAHRGTIADRYHLRLLYQQCPESEMGLDKGRPEMVRRSLFEVGASVGEQLLAVARLTKESGAFGLVADSGTVELGLQGQLSEDARLEARLSREKGYWQDDLTDRTALTLLYSRQATDEDYVSMKLGYAWEEEGLGRAVRDWRLSVAYAKPL